MNDDFIYKALPKVRKDFAESLYVRISTAAQRDHQPGTYPLRRIPRRLQVAMILLAMLVLVAWSQIRLWIRYVPIGDLWLVEFSNSQPGTELQKLQPIPTPGHLPTAIIAGEIIMLSSAFEGVSPGWIPAGFSPTKIPDSGYNYEEAIGMWSNDKQQTIRLFVVPKTGGARPYAPPGMYEEVEINGQSAVLIFGRLAPNSAEDPQAQRQWDETLGLQVAWSITDSTYTKDSIYTLETLGSYVSTDDLIRMAESIKVVEPVVEPVKIAPGYVEETMTP